MMKNLSLILNIVLLAAVGYLDYYDFSGKKVKAVAEKINNSHLATDSSGHRPPLAYVELDSLNENITYIKERRKELDAEMKAIEAGHENGYRNLQAQKDNFLKKGGTMKPPACTGPKPTPTATSRPHRPAPAGRQKKLENIKRTPRKTMAPGHCRGQ